MKAAARTVRSNEQNTFVVARHIIEMAESPDTVMVVAEALKKDVKLLEGLKTRLLYALTSHPASRQVLESLFSDHKVKRQFRREHRIFARARAEDLFRPN
jgi:hypothetical protein